MESLLALLEHGQSYWLDNLTRDMIRDGSLARRVELEGLRGVTSNPAIFHKAISGGSLYEQQIRELAESGASVAGIYETLAVTDVQEACDVLRPVWQTSDGVDGYVSLEVSPHLVHDTDASVQEAMRLWEAVDRPNLMVKIPGTPAGIPAIEQLLFDGVNINVTLLFSIPAYEAVHDAYIRALTRRQEAGRPLGTVASVASFFLSRIDVLVDGLLAHRIDRTSAKPDGPSALYGTSAIASARLAYRSFESRVSQDDWQALVAKGEYLLRGPYKGDSDALKELEEDLGQIMNRNWAELIVRIREELRLLGGSGGSERTSVPDGAGEIATLEERVRELEQLGAVVHGIAADVDDVDELGAPRVALRENEVPLRGVFPGIGGQDV